MAVLKGQDSTDNTSKHLEKSAGSSENKIEDNANLVAGYEEREQGLKDQVQDWKQKYNELQAELLINKQLLVDQKKE